MHKTPQRPTKSRKRQSPTYGSPGRGSPMYGSPSSSPPKRRSSPSLPSVFSIGSPGSGSPFRSPGRGSPSKINDEEEEEIGNNNNAKKGRKVKKQGNEAVKSYEKDGDSQKSLANELAVYKHLDTMYSGKRIRDLINEKFMELNNASHIYPGVNLIFPSFIGLKENEYNIKLKAFVDNLHLTYHHIDDVFIKGTTEIMTTTILGTTSKYETDPVYNPNDLQLLENIKTALKENGIIYADNDLINGEIMSNLFRTNDGNALLLDFETSEVKTSKGGRKKTNRKRNIKKRTRKKRNIKKN